MRSHDLVLVGVLLAIPLLAAGCNGDDASGPGAGTLRITVTQEGDPHGYGVRIDNSEPLPVVSGSPVELAGVPPGDHILMLGSIPGNCAVAGENPRTVSVSPGATAVVTFQVTCSSPLGSLEISTTASGESLDPDGYVIVRDGNGIRTPIGRVESLLVPGLSPGEHTVELREVAPSDY
jgi:hypothetical protein